MDKRKIKEAMQIRIFEELLKKQVRYVLESGCGVAPEERERMLRDEVMVLRREREETHDDTMDRFWEHVHRCEAGFGGALGVIGQLQDKEKRGTEEMESIMLGTLADMAGWMGYKLVEKESGA